MPDKAGLLYFYTMSESHKNFLIYSASAGSGKTFTLVANYLLKILEPGGSFTQVLAITFTNKATAEMKARIIAELDILASGKESVHLPTLLESLPFSESELRTRASSQLQRILHNYSSFSVSTIDSYFQLLARTLTRELKIPIKFEIELNEERVRHEIAGRLLSKAGYDQELTEWLRELLYDKLQEGKGWKIQPELRNMTKEVISKDEARELAQYADRDKIRQLLNELDSIRNSFESNLKSIGTSGVEAIKESGYPLSDFAYGEAGAAAYFQKLISRDKKKWEPGTRVMKAISNPDSLLSKEKSKNATLKKLVNEILHPLLDQALEIYSSGIYLYNSADAVKRFLYYTGIIPVIGESLKQFRDEHQLFLLSDTTRLLRDNVAEQDAPFIFEKSGTRFKHVFIDEFQDTSTDQWNILLPLAKNTLANGDQLLLVGDAKQSIYRWRGGNIQLIRKDAASDLRNFSSSLSNRILETNWRSAQRIVEFNNQFFPKFAERLNSNYVDFADESLTQGYNAKNVEQNYVEKNALKGYVEFTYFPDKKEVSSGEDEEDANGWKDRALKNLKETIADCLSYGYQLQDIAILFRNNQEEALIASYLLENTQWSFLSSASLKLSSHPSVRFLLNCMYILAEKDQPVNRSEAEEFLVLKGLHQTSGSLPHAKIKYFADDTWFKKTLLPIQEQSNSLPVNMTLSLLREKSGLSAADPFIDAFEDIVSEYASKNSGGLNVFIDWWEEQLETKNFCLDMPESANAIRLLSIHRSKGLEFNVVVIPFLDWKLLPDQRTRMWASSDAPPFNIVPHLHIAAGKNLMNSVFDKDFIRECKNSMQDNINLVYVAFTRPKMRLYCSGPKTNRTDGISASIFEVIESDNTFEKQENDGVIHFSKGNKELHTVKSEIKKGNNFYSHLSQNPSAINSISEFTAPILATRPETREIIIGKAVHEVIANTITTEKLDRIIEATAIKYQLKVQDFGSIAERVILQLQQQGWMDASWKVYAEADFCDEHGNILRPDRVLHKENETIVLDFKTGGADPAYAEQVNGYCNLLESIGFKNIKGYLVYPMADLIETVV